MAIQRRIQELEQAIAHDKAALALRSQLLRMQVHEGIHNRLASPSALFMAFSIGSLAAMFRRPRRRGKSAKEPREQGFGVGDAMHLVKTWLPLLIAAQQRMKAQSRADCNTAPPFHDN